jgi:hypothetical protein
LPVRCSNEGRWAGDASGTPSFDSCATHNCHRPPTPIISLILVDG